MITILLLDNQILMFKRFSVIYHILKVTLKNQNSPQPKLKDQISNFLNFNQY